MVNKFNLDRGRTDENKKRRRKVSPYSVLLLKLALSLCNLAQEKEHRSTAFAFLLYGFNRGMRGSSVYWVGITYDEQFCQHKVSCTGHGWGCKDNSLWVMLMAASGGQTSPSGGMPLGQWQSRKVAAGNTMRVSAGLEQVQGKTWIHALWWRSWILQVYQKRLGNKFVVWHSSKAVMAFN